MRRHAFRIVLFFAVALCAGCFQFWIEMAIDPRDPVSQPILTEMKPVRFVGASLEDLRDFPAEARRQVGFDLDAIQRDLEPTDWKTVRNVAG